MKDEMHRRGIIVTASDDNPGSKVFFTSTLFTDSSVTLDSALTTYTSYSTTTFVSAGTTYESSSGVVSIVSDAAEFSSLSAAGAFATDASSSATITATTGASDGATASAAAATATSSAASTHKSSSSKTGTLIPEIVVPVIIVLLLASFGAFFFFMRQRHHRALEEEARFEKARLNTSQSSPADNNSSRNLLPAGAAYGQSANEKPEQATDVKVRPLPYGQATSPPRPRRPDDSYIPPSAIGIARSTSSASAVPAKSVLRPPRSAHEMRDLPSNPRPSKRGSDSPYLSGGDIIDTYAAMRPSTAPHRSRRDDPPPQSRTDMRIPLPIKPQGRPPQKKTGLPPPPYNSNSAGRSPSSHPTSPAVWPSSGNGPAFSRAHAGAPDGSYGLTEENLRIARLVDRSHSSLSMARQKPDNASVSDVDDYDHARAARDDVSDISELDEEQERMASRMNSPMDNGRGTPTSGRIGTPMSSRGFIR